MLEDDYPSVFDSAFEYQFSLCWSAFIHSDENLEKIIEALVHLQVHLQVMILNVNVSLVIWQIIDLRSDSRRQEMVLETLELFKRKQQLRKFRSQPTFDPLSFKSSPDIY